ncbi:pyridoxal phosphate homeostasis protein [Uranotaenia lowii]|uniref:pyridoxal phosphate homeostasis protein n=1 Tax=Uranotaenia lowii TaxID=190385 RepID=UPI002478DA70|nr:pyridoxal phosphate homeostasis protein [Uranotaenia lowii]XP_055594025.1 pyridoxal phosphate homeostasis protein [Uranotaenia lowii]XP_055594100.1 pyridoxal phosphate homeostasis protein [Uranotaenia lowii]
MIRKVMGEVDVKLGIRQTLAAIEEAHSKRSKTSNLPKPLLVAVSKTKPIELILDGYSVGQRDFGENYVQELVEKANDPRILDQCKDIRWHFIGHLQTNKINKIIGLPNLHMIQTVHDIKLADNLNKAWEKVKAVDPENQKLNVLVQINTSGEDEKNGTQPADAVNLFRHVLEKCPNLLCHGIMTIGRFGHDYGTGPNPDFIELMKCHQDICGTFERDPAELQVSMGMSDDYVNAIEMGSTIVRVGSSIFGARAKKNAA